MVFEISSEHQHFLFGTNNNYYTIFSPFLILRRFKGNIPLMDLFTFKSTQRSQSPGKAVFKSKIQESWSNFPENMALMFVLLKIQFGQIASKVFENHIESFEQKLQTICSLNDYLNFTVQWLKFTYNLDDKFCPKLP